MYDVLFCKEVGEGVPSPSYGMMGRSFDFLEGSTLQNLVWHQCLNLIEKTQD